MLKGTTTFELQNVKTGELERYVDHNMFTNALNEIYNKNPFGLMNDLFGAPLVGVTNALRPAYSTVLGGIALFPQTITENANTLFAPAANHPVGIASMLDNPNTDLRRGSFNAIESGEVTNGYKYVYDFSTSQGNGVISAVCLTSKWAGATWLNNLSNFCCGATRTNEFSPFGYCREIKNGTGIGRIVWANDKGIFYTDQNLKNIYKYNAKSHSLALMCDYETCELLGTFSDYGWFCGTSTEVWSVATSGGTFTVQKMDCETGEITIESHTIEATLRQIATGGTGNPSSNIAYDEELDYIYLPNSAGNKFYKVKLSNIADVTEISVPDNSNLGTCTPFFVGNNFIIERDDTVNLADDSAINVAISRLGLYAFGYQGLWAYHSGARERTGLNVIAPYLATINNLDRAVNKTSDKTMKVTYTVTYT